MKTYIVHQVNCLGAFGAGFAKYLTSISPKIASDYKSHVSSYSNKRDLLGTFHVTYLNSRLSIVHIFSQYGYGRGKCHTDYSAMEKALINFRKEYPNDVANCICPYLMGCGLAGGDWSIVEEILDEYSIKPVKNIQIKPTTNMKYATFVGSRKAPDAVIKECSKMVSEYVKRGYKVRSGNAEGFDQSLKDVGENDREIYLPYKDFGPKLKGKNVYIPDIEFNNYDKAVALVNKLHPNKQLKEWQMKYLARDVYQVLGKDLNTPSELVICWTEDGADNIEMLTSKTGGTAMAIRIAEYYHIPVININKK